MRYWPLSALSKSPSMPASCAWELEHVHAQRRLSHYAMTHAHQVAWHTQSYGLPLVIIESEGTANCLAYTGVPDFMDFLTLERAGFVDTGTAFFLLVEALH